MHANITGNMNFYHMPTWPHTKPNQALGIVIRFKKKKKKSDAALY